MNKATSSDQLGHPGFRSLGFLVCFGVGLLFIVLPLVMLALESIPWSSAVDLFATLNNFGASIYAAILARAGMLPLQGYASLWVGIVTLALGLVALSHQSFKTHARRLFWARTVILALLVTMFAASFLYGPGVTAVLKAVNIQHDTFFGIQLFIVVGLDILTRGVIAVVGFAVALAFVLVMVDELSESGRGFWPKFFGNKTDEAAESSLID